MSITRIVSHICLALFLVALGMPAGWLLATYGTLKPCEILVHDMAQETLIKTNDVFGEKSTVSTKSEEWALARSVAFKATEDYSSSRCLKELPPRLSPFSK